MFQLLPWGHVLFYLNCVFSLTTDAGVKKVAISTTLEVFIYATLTAISCQIFVLRASLIYFTFYRTLSYLLTSERQMWAIRTHWLPGGRCRLPGLFHLRFSLSLSLDVQPLPILTWAIEERERSFVGKPRRRLLPSINAIHLLHSIFLSGQTNKQTHVVRILIYSFIRESSLIRLPSFSLRTIKPGNRTSKQRGGRRGRCTVSSIRRRD